MERNNQQYLQALEKAVGGMVMSSVTDDKGIILQVNDYFCQFTQYDKKELLGNTHSVIKSGIHGKVFYDHMWRTIIKGNIWKGQICNKLKTGDLYWVEAVIIPIKNTSGKVENYLSVCLDITEKRGYEGELNRHKDKLRELGYVNNHLIHSISHELKGPLATFQGLLQLFQEGILSADEFKNLAPRVERDIEAARGLLAKLENTSI